MSWFLDTFPPSIYLCTVKTVSEKKILFVLCGFSISWNVDSRLRSWLPASLHSSCSFHFDKPFSIHFSPAMDSLCKCVLFLSNAAKWPLCWWRKIGTNLWSVLCSGWVTRRRGLSLFVIDPAEQLKNIFLFVLSFFCRWWHEVIELYFMRRSRGRLCERGNAIMRTLLRRDLIQMALSPD